MFFGKKKVSVALALAGCILVTSEFQVFAAAPQSDTQLIETVNYEINIAPLAKVWDQIPVMASVAVDTQEWSGKALANTDTTIDVYAEANGTTLGRMYKNTVATVEEEGTEWCKITSGSVVGYVKTEALLFGSAAVERAKVVCAEGTKDAQTIEEIQAEEKRQADVRLLAALIYCEAGNQPYDGKVAVGSVVLNRVESGRFPNTIEGVIYQRGQFTPASSGKLARVLRNNNIPAACYQAAQDALTGADPVHGALFFNTGKVGTRGYRLGDHYFR